LTSPFQIQWLLSSACLATAILKQDARLSDSSRRPTTCRLLSRCSLPSEDSIMVDCEQWLPVKYRDTNTYGSLYADTSADSFTSFELVIAMRLMAIGGFVAYWGIVTRWNYGWDVADGAYRMFVRAVDSDLRISTCGFHIKDGRFRIFQY
ncbi:hypothetical protein EDD85DRAFT_972870, partial [Armillaria nabsnona]